MTNLKNKFLSVALLSATLISNPMAEEDESVGPSLFGEGKRRTFLINQKDIKFTEKDERKNTFHGGISVIEGPRSKYARLLSENQVTPKKDGSYAYKVGEVSDNTRRALDAFTVTTIAGMTYESDMITIANSEHRTDIYKAKMKQVLDNWNNPGMTPVYIVPENTSDTNNAFFTLISNGLDDDIAVVQFFPIEKNGKIVGNVGNSFEAKAHEAGHALLTRMNKMTFYGGGIQIYAFHEAFGDLTSLFLMLDDANICRDIIKKAGGDLGKIRQLVEFGEETGDAIFGSPLRMRNDNGKISDFNVDWGHYELSLYISGAVYNIIQKAYKQAFDAKPAQYMDNHPDRLLYDVGRAVRLMFIESAMNIPIDSSMNLVDWSRSFTAAAKSPIVTVDGVHIDWGKIVKDEMEAREFEISSWLNNARGLAGEHGLKGEEQKNSKGKRCNFGHCKG